MIEPATNIVAFLRFKITLFDDVGGGTLHEHTIEPRQLIDLILTTHAEQKRDLPLLKLATFGEQRTLNNSLRSATNLKEITGVECDYDGGNMDPEEAVQILAENGIWAIVHNSPRAKYQYPRWRILCPTSRALPVSDRHKLVARVNGVLGGILSPESFVDAQAFYYGTCDETDEMFVKAVEGHPIDTLPHLDAVAIGPPAKTGTASNTRTIPSLPQNKTGLGLELYQRRTLDADQLKTILANMPNGMGLDTPWKDRTVWVALAHAIAGATNHAPWAREQFVEWSAQYDGDLTEPERLWDTMVPGHIRAGFSTIVSLYDRQNGAGSFWRLIDRVQGADTSAAPVDGKLLVSSAAFVKGFVPPDYLVDGIVQRRFCYSLTAPTGHGKTAVALLLAACVATGKPFGSAAVETGRVAYFAGENPDDVRARWIAMCEHLNIDPDKVSVHFLAGTLDLDEARPQIAKEAEDAGGFDLLVIDTGAAFFRGDDDNANVQMGTFARGCRQLTQMAGGPCVLVLMHPTKTPDRSNLVPRGGGAFLAEVDGNLTAWRDDVLVSLHHAGKLRGPGFDPLSLELSTVHSERLKDVRGRIVPTVIATAISKSEHVQREQVAESQENQLLHVIFLHKGKPGQFLAERLGWPRLQKVYEVANRLIADGLIKKNRRGYALTAAGDAEAVRLGFKPRKNDAE